MGKRTLQGFDDRVGCRRKGARPVAQQQLAVALLLAGDDLVDDHGAARGDGLLRGGSPGLAHHDVVGHQQARDLVGPSEN